MGVKWPSGRTQRNIENLLRFQDLPRVFYIQRVGTRDNELRSAWREFVADWARESCSLRSSGNAGVPSLCVVARLRDFDFEVPEVDSGIGIRWWWGCPSALEMRLGSRMANQHIGDGSPVLGRWREYVLPGLVSSDVQLAEHVWGQVAEDPRLLLRSLADYWENRGQTDNVDSIDGVVELIKANEGTYSVGQEVPSHLRRIWASGGLVYTPEYGLEVHPGLLAHKGRDSDVLHRLWRGQAELLLPILNELRVRICEDLSKAFGNDWATKWWTPSTEYELREVERSPIGAEFGYIDHLLRFVSKRSNRHPLNEKHQLVELVVHAKNLRNQIAHYRPVLFQQFAELCDKRDGLRM